MKNRTSVAITTFDFSFMFLAHGVFTTKGEKLIILLLILIIMRDLYSAMSSAIRSYAEALRSMRGGP